MRTDSTPLPATGRRTRVGAWAAFLLVLPTLATPLVTLFVVVPTLLAVLAAVGVQPLRRLPLPVTATAVAAASFLGDAGFLLTREGWAEARWALPWMPFELAALLVVSARVVRRAPVRPVVVLGALSGAAAVVLPLRFSLRESPAAPEQSFLGVLCAAVLALGAAGLGLRRRAQDRHRAEEIDRARREQRLQVARDLHDFVAHEVTGILLETQAARVAEYDETRTRELLERLEAAGQRALASMDDTLRLLREPDSRTGSHTDSRSDSGTEPPPTRVRGLGDLAALLGRFEESGGARTTLALAPGLAGALPGEVEDAAYRLVIEALTNVRRHAPGARLVTVEVTREAAGLRVAVGDDGGVRPDGEVPAPRAGGGTGLAALTERFTGLRGQLEAGPGAEGWTVVGVLPLDRPGG
ncbi:histidine kinase [Streptomyces albidoflavus]|uniref:sensor histidine kinase n=1 Tax=Streptomyces albidoflavus TaxID=1886 RepID=UPI0033FB8641